MKIYEERHSKSELGREKVGERMRDTNRDRMRDLPCISSKILFFKHVNLNTFISCMLHRTFLWQLNTKESDDSVGLIVCQSIVCNQSG